MNRILSSLLLIILFYAPLKAEPTTPIMLVDGNQLLSHCESSQDVGRIGLCYGYVMGAIDRLEVSRGIEGKSSCLPDGVKPQALIDLVISYLKGHPQDRHFPAAGVVHFAIVYGYKTCADLAR